MNATEKLAESWLLKNGYFDLQFRYGETPDFLTNRGGIEVKRAAFRRVYFSGNQIIKIKETDSKLLIFVKGMEMPIFCSFEDLEKHGFSTIEIRNTGKVIGVKKSTREALERQKLSPTETYDHVLNRLLDSIEIAEKKAK